MEVEKAVELLKDACYKLADFTGEKIPMEDYNKILRDQTKSAFPDIEWGDNDHHHPGRNMEHVIHWILFGAGMDIKNTGSYGNSKSFVYKNGFAPELIEKGIEKYKDFIKNLAAYI